MKIKCDLIIQNLQSHNANQASNDKMHKSAVVGLYRTREDDDERTEIASSNAPIILTVEAKSVNMKYKLKRIETYTKFISEGKATLKLIDENVYLLLSNAPSLTLINFFSFISIKLAKSGLKTNKPDLETKQPNKSFVSRLLSSERCNIGANSLTTISPLCEKELSDLMKAKNAANKSTASPIRATATFARPSSNFKKSLSDLSVATKANESKLTRHASSDLLVQLNDEQKRVLKAVKDGYNVFFTGSGGSGKSFLINIIRKCLPHDSSFVTASTGVAASLIGGITLHAFAGLSGSDAELPGDERDEEEQKTARIKAAIDKVMRSKEKLSNWRQCKHLIIDEISMIDADTFDTLNAIARAVKKNEQPFGGIQVILSGDFLQLPPVTKFRQEKKRFCFQSKMWTESIHLTVQLTQVKRQSDAVFIEMLEEIRFGRCSDKTAQILERNKAKDLSNQDILPTRLCTHKDDVELINKKELEALKSPEQRYKAIDSNTFATKLLEKLCPAKDELVLKLNAQVMLIKNLDVGNSLVNGARGCVVAFSDSNLPVVKFLNGSQLTIKYESWSFRLSADGPMVTRKQLPLQLAWAISIHKSQVSF